MRIKDYIAHQLIDTPLEKPARRLRGITQILHRKRHPELREIYLESARSEAVMHRVITPSMNCIDIGAHLGSTLSLIKKLAPQGRHIAIEPVPYKSEWLKRKFPTVEIFQVALSDVEGEAKFYVQPQHSGFSGLQLHTLAKTADQPVEILTVHRVQLDQLVSEERRIGFIKIDVEGGELPALKGAELIIKRDHPTILFECTKSALKAHGISASDVYTFFRDHNYALFLFKDWLGQADPLSNERFVQAMDYPFQAFNFLAVPFFS